MEELWKELNFEMKSCFKCKLNIGRKNVVIGEGNINSKIMFIGEGPGEDEDALGRPFVGKAGILLTKIFNSVGLKREDVFITNIVKCRPPENRNPDSEEIDCCFPFLEAQIALINPQLIVTIGSIATKRILGDRIDKSIGITKLRGKAFDWDGGIQIFPIFHPSYLLRNPSTKEGSPKWFTWQDMKYIKEEYNRFIEIG